MSYTSFPQSNCGGQSGSRFQGSDPALVDRMLAKYPEPIHRRDTLKRGYYTSNNHYCDVSSAHPGHIPRPYTYPYWDRTSRPRLRGGLRGDLSGYEYPSLLKQDGHHSSCRPQNLEELTSGEGKDDLDDYGLEIIHEYVDDRFARMSATRNIYDETRLSVLSPPLLAHLSPANDPPYNILRPKLHQKEERSCFLKHLIQFFVGFTTIESDIALGCEPGQPTPKHILDKESEVEAVEGAKPEEERRRRRGRERKLRRLSGHKANMAALEGQLQLQKGSPSTTMRSKYDALLAHHYTLSNPQKCESGEIRSYPGLREFIPPDARHRHERQNRRPSPLRNELSK